MRSIWLALLLAAAVQGAVAAGPAADSAHAFGSANILGQRAEHERVTRRALQCGIAPAPCFEGTMMYNLAGGSSYFGAVGAPDNYPARFGGGPDRWHCDNGDFFAGAGYPRTRAQATAAIQDCWNFARDIQDPGVPGNPNRGPTRGAIPAAKALVNSKGQVSASDPGSSYLSSCTYDGVSGRAKCNVYEAWGYRLHTVEDFYSHGNWVDLPDPGKPVAVNNPPGLGNPPGLWFDTRKAFALRDERLSTDCYPSSSCAGRIRHDEEINKDKGAIDVATGNTSDPITARGKIVANKRTNFSRAVEGAVAEVRAQWELLRWALVQKYGQDHGAKMACALWRDHSSNCNHRFVALAVGSDDESAANGSSLRAGLDPGDDASVATFDQGDDPADALERALYSAADGLVADQSDDPAQIPAGPGRDTIPPDALAPEEEEAELGAVPAPSIPAPPPPPVPDPTREGAAVLLNGDDLNDVGHLVDAIQDAGRDGVHVSVGIVGQGWAPEALVRAVEGSGGTIVALRGIDDGLAQTLESAGLTLQDDAMGPDWGAPLEPGGAPVEGVTDSSEDKYPLVDSGNDQELVVNARDKPVTVELYDTEAGTTEKATATNGDPATMALRDETGYEVRITSAGGRQFQLAVSDAD